MKNYILIACLLIFTLFFEKSYAQVNPETLKQIESLLNEKKSRTPAEQKIDSRLLQAIKEKENRPMAEGVQLEPANINADKSGNLMVDIKAIVTDELLTKIQALGGKIVYPSAEYHTIRATVNIAAVRAIANYPEVQFIQPAVQSMTVDGNELKAEINFIEPEIKNTTSEPEEKKQNINKQLISYLKNKNKITSANEYSPPGLPVISQGDRTHRADDTRNTYGYSGEGIRIGVLSSSYNAHSGAAKDVANGELPGATNPFGNTDAVTVVQDYPGGSDEGRAMLQIVHDLAPKAKLFFATANVSEAGFAANIKKLRAAPYNCDIIIDDVEYLDEPPFQDGMVAQAVNAVTADGALYFSSAGNYGSLEKKLSSVYEGDFNDNGSLPFNTGKPGSIHNFGTVALPVNGDIITSSFPVSTLNGNRYILNWSDPIGKSSNDYDLFLVKADGTIKASSTNIQGGSQDPLEFLYVLKINSGDRLVVFKDSSAKVRAFRLNAGFAAYGDAALKIGTTGQTFGHNCAVNAFSVAATPANFPGPYPNAFNAANNVELFTSDGLRRIFFNADTTAVTPGNFLYSTNGGTVRAKPDVTAADGVSTNVTGTDLFNPFFYGTSAAAPHAGAIAALLKSANPDLTPAQIRTILTGTALDIETAGYDNISGYGILQAFEAMQQLAPTPSANLINDSVSVTDGNMSNHNGFVEPGESGDLTVRLKNISLAVATSVTGTLTTVTNGVTITQNNADYGKINANGGTAENATSYVFKTDKSVACGSTIGFFLTVTYNGGKSSSKVFEFFVTVGEQPYKNIIAKLGAPTAGATYEVSTGTQTGRLGRGVTISTCDTLIPNPGVLASAGFDPRLYDAYIFTNTSNVSQCVQTTMASDSGFNMYCAAYNDSGFVADSPNVHFLADPGQSALVQSYSFEVASKKSFTVVVHEVNSGTLAGTPYILSVSLSNCGQSVLAVNIFNLTALADQIKQQIPLHWTVAADQSVRFYEVQRSIDGIHFSSLQTVQSSLSPVQKTYEYIDQFPVNGNNYYRIKEVDINGIITYSNIVKSAISIKNEIAVVPNPASTYVNVISQTIIKQIQLLDSKGQLLQTINPQTNNYRIQISKLAAGEYFLHIQTTNEIVNKKFVKQ